MSWLVIGIAWLTLSVLVAVWWTRLVTYTCPARLDDDGATRATSLDMGRSVSPCSQQPHAARDADFGTWRRRS
jgi:hypothetical protein